MPDGRSLGTGAPLIEDVVEESTEEEAEADDPLATGKRRVLRLASSGEPVRPGRITQRQPPQEQLMRETRAMKATAAKKAAKAAVAKRTVSGPRF